MFMSSIACFYAYCFNQYFDILILELLWRRMAKAFACRLPSAWAWADFRPKLTNFDEVVQST